MSPLRKRSFQTALSIVFLDNLALSVIYPIFTPLILEKQKLLLPFSYSLSERMLLLGLLIACFPFMQFIGSPTFESLAKKKGERAAFIISLIGQAIGLFLTGVGIAINSYLLMIFSRLLSGFCAGNLTLCLQIITAYSSALKNRIKTSKIVSGLTGISFVIAIVIGGVFSNTTLSKIFNPYLPFWIICLFALFNLFGIRKNRLLTQLQASQEVFTKTFFSQLFTPSIYSLYLLLFFFMVGWIVSLQFVSSFLIEHFHGTITMSTLIFIGAGLGWLISYFWIQKFLLRTFSPLTILLLSLSFLTLTIFFASISSAYYLFFHFLIFGSIFASLVWTNCLTLISKQSSNFMEEKLLETNQSTATLSIMIAPLAGGLIGQYDIRTIYQFASLSILLSLVILFSFKNKIKKKISSHS
jgi:DHA1 family tetracycline resistance protein-like MFS transporter